MSPWPIAFDTPSEFRLQSNGHLVLCNLVWTCMFLPCGWSGEGLYAHVFSANIFPLTFRPILSLSFCDSVMYQSRSDDKTIGRGGRRFFHYRLIKFTASSRVVWKWTKVKMCKFFNYTQLDIYFHQCFNGC